MRSCAIALLCLLEVVAHGAEPVSAIEAPSDIKVMKNQWSLMASLFAFCEEQLPAEKSDFDNAWAQYKIEFGNEDAVAWQDVASMGADGPRFLGKYFFIWATTRSKMLAGLTPEWASVNCLPQLDLNDPRNLTVKFLAEWKSYVRNNPPGQSK